MNVELSAWDTQRLRQEACGGCAASWGVESQTALEKKKLAIVFVFGGLPTPVTVDEKPGWARNGCPNSMYSYMAVSDTCFDFPANSAQGVEMFCVFVFSYLWSGNCQG